MKIERSTSRTKRTVLCDEKIQHVGMLRSGCIRYGLVAASTANEREDEEEHVDDVQVQVECGEDVLFRREGVLVLSSKHQLSVEHQVLKYTSSSYLDKQSVPAACQTPSIKIKVTTPR